VAGANHERDDLWTFSFEPVETGEHMLHVRLEYATAAHARHEPADALAGKFLGLLLPGSPFSVYVQSDWVAGEGRRVSGEKLMRRNDRGTKSWLRNVLMRPKCGCVTGGNWAPLQPRGRWRTWTSCPCVATGRIDRGCGGTWAR
jgi:hypothetical protein